MDPAGIPHGFWAGGSGLWVPVGADGALAPPAHTALEASLCILPVPPAALDLSPAQAARESSDPELLGTRSQGQVSVTMMGHLQPLPAARQGQ